MVVVERTRAYRSHRNHPAFPTQWVYGLYRALPGARALWPPSPVKVSLHELDTSVEVPGPHVFSVRFRRPRQERHQRPPHPAPRFVTLRNAPLSGRDRITIWPVQIAVKHYFRKTEND